MKLKNAAILLLTATIWGFAFVAQSVGMEHIGPFTFGCARMFIGCAVLLPVVAVLRTQRLSGDVQTRRRAAKCTVIGGVCCGLVLAAASLTQQFGLLYTTVGKAGFITACYIVIVPLVSLLLGKRCGPYVALGVALAVLGLYFLCIKEGLSIGRGDVLVFICAFLFAGHILVIDHFSPHADCVAMSAIQFLVAGMVAGVGMLLFEQPQLSSLLAAWKPVLYTGALSSGVAYTLQIIGQKGMNPTVSSLIMSLESVISVLAGFLLLGQALSARELFGCALMFAAIVLAQLPARKRTALTK